MKIHVVDSRNVHVVPEVTAIGNMIGASGSMNGGWCSMSNGSNSSSKNGSGERSAPGNNARSANTPARARANSARAATPTIDKAQLSKLSGDSST